MALFLVFQQVQLVVLARLIVRPGRVVALVLGHLVLYHGPSQFLFRVAPSPLGQLHLRQRELSFFKVQSPSDQHSFASWRSYFTLLLLD